MKTILIFTFSILALSAFSQEKLQFSKAFFVQLTSEKSSQFIAKDTTITVPQGKVWEVTNTKVFMTYDNRIIADKTYLYLNECIITYATNQFAQHTDTMWLPSGTYRITIRTEEKNQREGRFNFNAFLSGVEYDIIKLDH